MSYLCNVLQRTTIQHPSRIVLFKYNSGPTPAPGPPPTTTRLLGDIVSTVLRTSPIYFAQTRTDVLSEPSATILREQLVYEDTIFNQPQTTFLVPLHYLIIMHANDMPSFHSLYS